MITKSDEERNQRETAGLVRLLGRLGVDRAVAYQLMGTSWSGLSAILSLALLARFLTPVEQGDFYTFSGVLATTALFELGLSYVLMQCASHEAAHLQWTEDGLLTGDVRAKARLADLLRSGLRWYLTIALLVAVLLGIGGYLFFLEFHAAGSHIHWRTPWILTALVAAFTLVFAPILGVIEGCGLVRQVVGLRGLQSVATSVGLWFGLCAHGALYALPASSGAGLLVIAGWLLMTKKRFLADLLAFRSQEHGLNWRAEIWPFQWKIGLSFASGYLTYNLFVTALYAFRRPIAAGQMGMSLSIVMGITTLAFSWLTTKAAPFGTLIARRDWHGLDKLFFASVTRSCGVIVLGGAAFIGVDILMSALHIAFAHRLLPLAPLTVLVIAAIANHLVNCEAVYLRAHKIEPFLAPSLCTGVLVAAFDLLLARPFGALAILVAYLSVIVVVSLGWGTLVFFRLRRELHIPAAA